MVYREFVAWRRLCKRLRRIQRSSAECPPLSIPVLLGFKGVETSVLSTVFLRFLAALPTLLSEVVARRGTDGLCFWTAREPRGCSAGRSARGESLDVSEATYETKRERSHGVVSSSSGRERPR